jgi:hypothetical protein
MQSRVPTGPGTVALLLTLITVVFISCTAESTLQSLQENFVSREETLNELKGSIWEIASSTKDFAVLSSNITNGKGELIDFFEKDGQRRTVPEAIETTFKDRQQKVLRVKDLMNSLGADYVNSDITKGAVWVTMRGGGVLASDQGYIFVQNNDVQSYHLKYYLAIPNQRGWYAYIN